MRVEVFIGTRGQAAAFKSFLDAYFDDQDARDDVADKVVAAGLKEAGKPAKAEPAVEPTPLEQAIDKAQKEAPAATPQTEQPDTTSDPFALLGGGLEPVATEAAETAAPAAEKKRGRPKKEEAKAAEAEKKLTLADIRRISDKVCEETGIPVIQEALAKFNAVDDKGTLRMSSLREQDYALYVEFLNKKMNDAGKEKVA
jgi:hypothetical protein